MDMDENMIKILLERGYLEIVGENQVGDPIYKITPEFYEEQAELVAWMRQQDSDLLNSLWFKGYVDVKMDDDGNGYMYLTDKSDTWLESEDLTEEEKSMMYLIYSTGTYLED